MNVARRNEILHAINAAGGRVKVYQTIRTAHLERAKEFVPAVYLYRQHRYDFAPALASRLPVYRLGLIDTAWVLARARVSVLEVNEPLMREGLAGSLVAVLAARLGSAGNTRIVSYALENLDPFSRPVTRWRSRIRVVVDQLLARLLANRLDQLCYGTDSARELYTRLLPSGGHGTQVVLPALPSPCSCDQVGEFEQPTAVFLGDFGERKGFDAVLAAWPKVRSRIPTARLLLLGKGKLETQAAQLAAADENVKVLVDPPRELIHRYLRRAQVLVLPSRRRPRWREQVGLPIVEALAHGCRIVTTGETGLASWLTQAGHLVVDQANLDTQLPVALTEALEESPRWTGSALPLPTQDGRQAADTWMHQRA